MRQISQQVGNPANAIVQNYQTLMSIDDVAELKAKALELLGRGGISPKNAAKFRGVVAREDNVGRLRQYFTNFVLAADGHKVLQVGR
jgi:hypothetical protein